MEFPAFVSKSYTLFSRKASCARTINLGLEVMETDAGRNQYAFYKRAGLKGMVRPSGANGTARGSYEQNDHLFHVVGPTLYDLDHQLNTLATYTIDNDDAPVTLAGSADTLMVVSAGVMYRIFGGVITTIATPFIPIAIVFIDTYFVALSSTYQQFFFSRDDGATWDALDFQTAEATANQMIMLKVVHPELWIIGNRITQVFGVGTDPDQPFIPRQDAVIQEGTAAASSVVNFGGSLAWIGKNKDGEGSVVRMNGYNASRISKLNIENAIRGYTVVSDAIGSSYQLNGHLKLQITFPTEDTTWEYDAMADDWVEVNAWDATLGRYKHHRANTIVSAFKKILGGDYENGWLFEISPDFYSDDVDGLMGTSGIIRWERTAPHLVKENKKVQYHRMELDCERGVGDGSNGNIANGPISPEYDPLVGIEWSDDGGRNFSSTFYRSLGKMGESKKKVDINAPGTGEDRVWRVWGTASVKVAIFNMFFDAETLAH